jgi:hypothetical protein
MGIPLIQRKLHSHAFSFHCDWFEHFKILRGSPHPYNFYGAPDQNFEVLPLCTVHLQPLSFEFQSSFRRLTGVSGGRRRVLSGV